MEHAFRFEEPRPWRTAAIVASGIAAIELVFLIVAGALLTARPLAHRHATASASAVRRPALAATAKPHARRPAILPRQRTRIVVLNGNGEAGAAGNEADALRARGYDISAVGNAPQHVSGPSLVMYRPGFEAEAKRLARDTGTRIVTAIDGIKTSTLHRAKLVIVLGTS